MVLDFWASWCQPCRTSIPIVGRVAAARAAAGVVTVGINVESELSPARVVAAHRALAMSIPTLQDPGWQIQSAYGVESLPTLIVIDRTGVVRRFHTGVPDEEWLDGAVRELL